MSERRHIDKPVIELLVLEQLPTGIWPLVGFKKWHKDARDGKQAEAHDSENSSRDVEREERGTGDLFSHSRIFPLDSLCFFPKLLINGLLSAANGE